MSLHNVYTYAQSIQRCCPSISSWVYPLDLSCLSHPFSHHQESSCQMRPAFELVHLFKLCTDQLFICQVWFHLQCVRNKEVCSSSLEVTCKAHCKCCHWSYALSRRLQAYVPIAMTLLSLSFSRRQPLGSNFQNHTVWQARSGCGPVKCWQLCWSFHMGSRSAIFFWA